MIVLPSLSHMVFKKSFIVIWHTLVLIIIRFESIKKKARVEHVQIIKRKIKKKLTASGQRRFGGGEKSRNVLKKQ